MIKSVEESGLQMKGISERIENEAKKKQNKTKRRTFFNVIRNISC